MEDSSVRKMRIMYVSNSRDNDFNNNPEKNKWNLLPYLLEKNGAEVKTIGKKELYKFYFEYLKFKPDIILTTWVPAGFIPVLLKKMGIIKSPIIHRWEDYYAESMTNYPRFLVSFMERYTAKNADYIITVLKTLYDASRRMNKKVFLLPYGITPGSKKTKINLNKLKTKKSNLKVIYLGDLTSRFKRVDKIISAAKNTNCDLFLFGEKPYAELIEMSEGYKNIHFMGWIDTQEVASILKQGNILVNTANHDMSMKFLDYINAGKPILALNDRPAKFFVHGKTAYLTNDFEKGLRELIRDKRVRSEIKKNMKNIKVYSWDDVSKIHMELYRAILSGQDLSTFVSDYYHV